MFVQEFSWKYFVSLHRVTHSYMHIFMHVCMHLFAYFHILHITNSLFNTALTTAKSFHIFVVN